MKQLSRRILLCGLIVWQMPTVLALGGSPLELEKMPPLVTTEKAPEKPIVDIQAMKKDVAFQRELISGSSDFRFKFLDQDITVYTTLQPMLQKIAQRYLKKIHPDYAGVVVMNEAGRILSLVSYQGPRIRADKHFRNTHENYALRPYRMASLAKVISAIAAMKHKEELCPETLVSYRGEAAELDPISIVTPSRKKSNTIKRETCGEAFQHSHNAPFGWLVTHDGLTPQLLSETYASFGFNEEIPFDVPLKYQSCAIIPQPKNASDRGAWFELARTSAGLSYQTQISPLHAAMVGMGIMSGKIPRPTLLSSVTIGDRHAFVEKASIFKQLTLAEETRNNLIEMMRQTVREGTAQGLQGIQTHDGSYVDTIGKTGTVSDIRWMMAGAQSPKYAKVSVAVVIMHYAEIKMVDGKPEQDIPSPAGLAKELLNAYFSLPGYSWGENDKFSSVEIRPGNYATTQN